MKKTYLSLALLLLGGLLLSGCGGGGTSSSSSSQSSVAPKKEAPVLNIKVANLNYVFTRGGAEYTFFKIGDDYMYQTYNTKRSKGKCSFAKKVGTSWQIYKTADGVLLKDITKSSDWTKSETTEYVSSVNGESILCSITSTVYDEAKGDQVEVKVNGTSTEMATTKLTWSDVYISAEYHVFSGSDYELPLKSKITNSMTATPSVIETNVSLLDSTVNKFPVVIPE